MPGILAKNQVLKIMTVVNISFSLQISVKDAAARDKVVSLGGQQRPASMALKAQGPCLKSLAGHQDEEDAEAGVDQDGDRQNHDRSFGEKFTDVRLADTREVEGGVLAVSNKCHDRVE